jgi:hypothetical protein
MRGTHILKLSSINFTWKRSETSLSLWPNFDFNFQSSILFWAFIRVRWSSDSSDFGHTDSCNCWNHNHHSVWYRNSHSKEFLKRSTDICHSKSPLYSSENDLFQYPKWKFDSSQMEGMTSFPFIRLLFQILFNFLILRSRKAEEFMTVLDSWDMFTIQNLVQSFCCDLPRFISSLSDFTVFFHLP